MREREIDVTKYSKVPFKEKGRDVNGWDCYGPLFVIYKEHRGILLPTFTSEYANTKDHEVIVQLINDDIKNNWKAVIKPDLPKPYDAMRIRLDANPMHCAMYVGNNKFIHCTEKAGTTVESIYSDVWRYRIIGYFRYEG